MEPQVYGNLMSYKVYIRPAAQKMDGYGSPAKTRHQESLRDILRILFKHGGGTTWDMAKTHLRSMSEVREQEKAYRRLLVGRTDRGKYTKGVAGIGLIKAGKSPGKPYSAYRLSPHGILYCMDALSPGRGEVDAAAAHYGSLLPKIFGRWRMLTRVLGPDAYGLRVLAKGLLLNSYTMSRADNPIYELMSFVHIKYRRNFESITERDLAEQISYWFYTFLLYRKGGAKKLKRVLARDEQLYEWYAGFFDEAKSYYAQRLRTMEDTAGIFGP